MPFPRDTILEISMTLVRWSGANSLRDPLISRLLGECVERGNAQIHPPPGAGKVLGEGEKGVVRWCPRSKMVQAHHVAIGGGGIHKVSGGLHLDVGVLRLPHWVSTHGIEQLVNGGGLRGQMQKFKRGELAAEFPPQSCGRGLPPKIGVAGGAAQVDVNDIGGGVEGYCLAHNIVHPQCPRLVRRLLQLVVGDGEGFVLREGVGSRIGAGL